VPRSVGDPLEVFTKRATFALDPCVHVLPACDDELDRKRV